MLKIIILIALAAGSVSTAFAQPTTDNMGLVSPKDAAELYQLHRGDGVGQLALPVAVTIRGIYCEYIATYKDEAGERTLYRIVWTTFRGEGDCPR